MQAHDDTIELKELSVSAKFKILVIDDEPMINRVVRHSLGKNYEIISANSGNEGLRMALLGNPDLVLLDLQIPDKDGFQICQILRTNKATQSIPIIVITGNAQIDNRIRIFNLGADDLLVKPIMGAELQARVQSKVRRIQEKLGSSRIIQCANLNIDLDKYEVFLGSERIEFSVLELELLLFLIKNKGVILKRSQILDAVWKNCSVSRRTIDTHILSLRKKLIHFDCEIVSVYGIGYGLKDKHSANLE